MATMRKQFHPSGVSTAESMGNKKGAIDLQSLRMNPNKPGSGPSKDQVLRRPSTANPKVAVSGRDIINSAPPKPKPKSGTSVRRGLKQPDHRPRASLFETESTLAVSQTTGNESTEAPQGSHHARDNSLSVAQHPKHSWQGHPEVISPLEPGTQTTWQQSSRSRKYSRDGSQLPERSAKRHHVETYNSADSNDLGNDIEFLGFVRDDSSSKSSEAAVERGPSLCEKREESDRDEISESFNHPKSPPAIANMVSKSFKPKLTIAIQL